MTFKKIKLARFSRIMMKCVDATLKTWIIRFHVIWYPCIIVSSNRKIEFFNLNNHYLKNGWEEGNDLCVKMLRILRRF